MPELHLSKPTPKQREFLRDEHKFLGFGGARGGGKSHAIRTLAVMLCYKYSGIKILIVRKTYPELQENHIKPLTELLNCYGKKEERFASYNDQKKEIRFPNASSIIFRYLETEKDAERFQGTEVDVLFLDEATQHEYNNVVKLNACVRGVNDFPKLIRYTANPGGAGHQWFKRLFIDRRFEGRERPVRVMWFSRRAYGDFLSSGKRPAQTEVRVMSEIRGKAIRSLRRLNDEERILLMSRYVDHIHGFENFIMDKLSIERDALKKQLEALGVKACDLQPVSVEVQKV